MSHHIEFPMRPHDQVWPGLSTRTGFLDPGAGLLDDGSVNMMINRGDVLEKRKGFVRGLDEHFNGVVCGLFKYTSTCGIEYLLVADQSGIHIRQPFDVPVFEHSDAYPFDSFHTDGPPSSYYWRNIDRYTCVDDELSVRAGAVVSDDPLATGDVMYWFKDATNLSYQVRVEYSFDENINTEQRIVVLIKGVGDLSAGSYLMAQVKFATGTYSYQLYHFDGSTLTELGTDGIVGSVTTPTGFLTLSYERDVTAGTFTARATVVPFGGNQSIISGAINAVQDASLGQVSGIGMGFDAGTQPDPRILVVDGGPI
jgi:hypothetical protein